VQKENKVKPFVLIAFFIVNIYAINLNTIDKKELEKNIANMLILGFDGTRVNSSSKICKDIKRYNPLGVILFEKNIKNKKQLKNLTSNLKKCSKNRNLLISIDQEGGAVQRLKSKYGFLGKYPSALRVSNYSIKKANKIYKKMSDELKSVGINFDLAPVVDLKLNKKNRVIVKKRRAYSSDPKIVVKYSNIFINQMHKNNIITSLKHFPGHGSSLGDTHKGFVDVSKLWSKKELIPYELMIKDNNIDTIMVAHVYNKNIDKKYPASLSFNTITKLLRWHMNYHGVVISDDLQMKAISSKYNLKKVLQLAIDAGIDILLFGNQLNKKDKVTVKKIVNTILELIHEGKIEIKDIKKANNRIRKLKEKLL
jgi:beta-N-acetylhexosaminidase